MANQLRANGLSRLEGLRSQAVSLRGLIGQHISYAYDLVSTVMTDGVEDETSLPFALESLATNRELAMHRDPQRDEPLHNVIYGLTDALGLMINAIVEDRRGRIEQEQPQMDDTVGNGVMDDALANFVVKIEEEDDVVTLDDDEPRVVQPPVEPRAVQPAPRMFLRRVVTTEVQKRRASAVEDIADRDQSPPAKRRRATMAAIDAVAANPAADGRFHCDKCDKSFERQLGLSKHAFMHTGIGCSMCNKTLKDAATLKKHMDERHQGGNAVALARPRPFVCPQCSSTHLQQGLLYKHMRDAHGLAPYGCAQCEQAYPRKNELIAHWKQTGHEGEVQSVQQQQPVMPLPWKDAATPKTPMRKKGDESVPATPAADGRFHCDQCDNSFETNHGLRVHAAQHTGIRCSKCRTTLRDDASLKKHMEEQHKGDALDSPRPRPFACPHCPVTRLTLSTLINHLRVDHGIHPYGCAQCDKTFAKKAELNAHWRNTGHQGETREVQQVLQQEAAIPEETTEDENEATEEAEVATPAADGRFPCDKCDRTFDTHLGLQRHVIMHNEVRCTTCGKFFKDEARLSKHMEEVHQGEENATPRPRPFACPLCPSTHRQKANLKAHLRDEHDINPYVCVECDETFARKRELKTHQRLTEHTGRADPMVMQSQQKEAQLQEQPLMQPLDHQKQPVEQAEMEEAVLQPVQPLDHEAQLQEQPMLQPVDHQKQPVEQPEMEEAMMQPILEEQPIVEQEQPAEQSQSPALLDLEEESQLMIEEPVEERPEMVEVPREIDVVELAD